MNKLKTFYNSFIKSISSPAYYRDIVKAPISFSLKYVFLLSYVFMFIFIATAAIYMATLLPKLPEFVSTAKTRLDEFYPVDLIITIKDGIVTTNKEEPVFLNIPEVTDEDIKHVVTIDTKAQVEDYYDYDTFFLVTDDSVVYPESDNKTYSVSSIKELQEDVEITKIDRNVYEEFLVVAYSSLDTIVQLAPFILIGVVLIVPFIASVFEFIRNIIIVAILSVITFVFALLLKINLPYLKIFQMGLHAVTIPLILMLVLFFTGATVPLLFIASFLLWMVIILTQYKEVTQK